MSKTTKETVEKKRSWGGRKPLSDEDKKVLVSCWPKNGMVKALGGKVKLEQTILKFIEKEYAKIILKKD